MRSRKTRFAFDVRARRSTVATGFATGGFDGDLFDQHDFQEVQRSARIFLRRRVHHRLRDRACRA